MARPRIYDEDAVINKALNLFWQKGFSDTSSRDLIAATGISNGSLFNSFGDKNRLYLACLQKYDAVYIAALERLLVSDIPFREKIEKVFKGTAKKIADGSGYEGCFYYNSSVDSGIHDDAISILSFLIIYLLEQAFHTAVDMARETGQLSVKSDGTDLAEYLMTVTTGLRSIVKANTPEAEMARSIRSAIKFLPL